jgi:hypothetical protein
LKHGREGSRERGDWNIGMKEYWKGSFYNRCAGGTPRKSEENGMHVGTEKIGTRLSLSIPQAIAVVESIVGIDTWKGG